MAPPRTRNAILHLLRWQGPKPAAVIAGHLALPRGTVDSAIHHARRKGLLRIVEWRRNLETRGRFTPVYDVGPGEDAPMPAPLTHAERNARYDRKAAMLRKAARPFCGAIHWLPGIAP